MRIWIGVLLLLAVAVAAAFGWQWLAADPGYVLIKARGVSIETSLVFALVALLLSWALLSVIWRLSRWPLRAWARDQKRRSRERLANGLTEFAEGRYLQAERDLAKAARQPALRGPALLALARAAHARGEDERASNALDEAAVDAEAAALALRARFLLERGRPADALALLKPNIATTSMVPVGWRVLIDAALLEGDAQTAMDALAPLARSQSLAPANMAAIESRVLCACLTAAPSAARLNAIWTAASRAQRKVPAVVTAFARRSASFGQTLAAMDEIETALRREWNESLASAYADLGPAELSTRTQHAEAWLAIAPNSPALLTTLGRLCRDQQLWGKAIQYLDRVTEIEGNSLAWEALGDCHAGKGDERLANRCYSNALHAARGEAVSALANQIRGPLDTHAMIVEERDQHGVPRLPVAR
ncbi:MAG: heme biosynthesis HemY N-terminal domain-containing protein [Dokdonella sp.]